MPIKNNERNQLKIDRLLFLREYMKENDIGYREIRKEIDKKPAFDVVLYSPNEYYTKVGLETIESWIEVARQIKNRNEKIS